MDIRFTQRDSNLGTYEARPQTSRCLIIRKGKLSNTIKFRVEQEEIPSIIENPIKCLGKWFDDSLKDENRQKILQQVDKGLKAIDKTELPGKHKVWLYQHGLLPRLVWPLTVYDITTTAVEALEKRVNRSTI